MGAQPSDCRTADVVRRLILYAAQHLFGVDVVAGYRDRRQRGPLPQVLMIDLRHRDVELMAQPVLQAGHYVAFLFERMRAFQPQLQR